MSGEETALACPRCAAVVPVEELLPQLQTNLDPGSTLVHTCARCRRPFSVSAKRAGTLLIEQRTDRLFKSILEVLAQADSSKRAS